VFSFRFPELSADRTVFSFRFPELSADSTSFSFRFPELSPDRTGISKLLAVADRAAGKLEREGGAVRAVAAGPPSSMVSTAAVAVKFD
jgi:hypothetical protein